MATKTVTVKKGDTLSKIAKDNKTTVSALAKANNIKDVNKIQAGAKLTVALPSSSSSGSKSSAPVVAPSTTAPKSSSGGGSSSKSSSTSNLKVGSRGDDVVALQKSLGITADGIYGPQTEAAVKAYQQKNNLAVDGIVGPQTRGALGTPAPKNDLASTTPPAPVTPDPKNPDQTVTPDVTDIPENNLGTVPDTVQATDPNAPADTTTTTPQDGTLPAPGAQPTATTPSAYAGSSVVDYLTSIGAPSDFASRFALARENGIQNYIGSKDQNTQLLNTLRSQNAGAIGNTDLAAAGAKAGAAAAAEAATTDEGPVNEFQAGIEAIMREFGIEPPSPAQSPQSSFTDVYKDVYENLGLQDIKDQFNLYSKEYGDLMDKKTDEITAVNNDPWLTEGVRKNRLAKIDQEYELRESNLLSKIQLTEGMYDSGRQDAQYVTSGIMTQYNRAQDLNESLIMKAIDIAESRSQAENDLLRDQASTVLNLIETYPDAGINTTDSLEVAASKASKSAYFTKRTSSSSGSTKTTFTTTQSNKGAANAGLPIEEFMQFSDDTKNLFINNPDFVAVFKEDLAAFNDGDLSKDEWIANIEDGTSNEVVKQDLIDYINSLPDNGNAGGGFWENPIIKGLVKFGNRVISPPGS